MKKYCLFIFSFFMVLGGNAQQGEWTWMKGNSSFGSSHGVQGIPSPSNYPGTRYAGGEWTDAAGNLWLFGGQEPGGICYNDLWKYDPLTNNWTWISGDNIPDQKGIYGTQGIAAPTNKPGARRFGVLTWVDNSGNFWLFGGWGYGADSVGGNLNDLWKYDPLTNEWTWMSGSDVQNQAGVYGTQGVPSPANHPGARQETAASWVDNAGNLWMFGGVGAGLFNDLWKYDIVTGEWTWMSGDNVPNQYGVYGTKGVPSPANKPGAREVFSKWKDLWGNFWLFGGAGKTTAAYSGGHLNDLWKYDIISGEWTWMTGDSIPYSIPKYGTQCQPSSNNTPGARKEDRTSWTDSKGNFWLWGGWNATLPFPYSGSLSDLWKYNPNCNTWTWVDGDTTASQSQVAGIMGISDPANNPGCNQGLMAWVDASDNLWMFGGFVNWGSKLWRYVIDTTCGMPSLPVATITGMDSICIGDSVVLTASGGVSYLWSNGSSSNIITVSPDSNTTYTLMIVDQNGCGSDTTTFNLTVNSLPIINAGADDTICSGNSITYTAIGSIGSYLWNTGAIGQNITANTAGVYIVTVSDGNNCNNSDTVNLAVNSSPVVLVSGDTSLCIGDTEILTASGADNYQWTDGSTNNNITITPAADTTYTIIGINTNGCSDTLDVFVKVNLLPSINAGEDDTICSGEQLQLNADGSNIVIYQWNPSTGLNITNSSSPLANPMNTISYTVTGTDMNGCINTDTIDIVVELSADADFTPDPNNGQIPLTVMFTNTSTNATTYQWSFGDSSFSTDKDPIHVFTEEGEYQVMLIANNNDNCPDTSIFTYIEVDATSTLWIPNSFTPNDDGVNDQFMIHTSGITNLEVAIFNRWGELIYEWNTIAEGWNGTSKGSVVETGVYVYKLKATGIDGVIYNKTGHVSLVR